MKYKINKIIREIANKKGLKYSEVDYHKWTKKTQTKKGEKMTIEQKLERMVGVDVDTKVLKKSQIQYR